MAVVQGLDLGGSIIRLATGALGGAPRGGELPVWVAEGPTGVVAVGHGARLAGGAGVTRRLGRWSEVLAAPSGAARLGALWGALRGPDAVAGVTVAMPSRWIGVHGPMVNDVLRASGVGVDRMVGRCDAAAVALGAALRGDVLVFVHDAEGLEAAVFSVSGQRVAARSRSRSLHHTLDAVDALLASSLAGLREGLSAEALAVALGPSREALLAGDEVSVAVPELGAMAAQLGVGQRVHIQDLLARAAGELGRAVTEAAGLRVSALSAVVVVDLLARVSGVAEAVGRDLGVPVVRADRGAVAEGALRLSASRHQQPGWQLDDALGPAGRRTSESVAVSLPPRVAVDGGRQTVVPPPLARAVGAGEARPTSLPPPRVSGSFSPPSSLPPPRLTGSFSPPTSLPPPRLTGSFSPPSSLPPPRLTGSFSPPSSLPPPRPTGAFARPAEVAPAAPARPPSDSPPPRASAPPSAPVAPTVTASAASRPLSAPSAAQPGDASTARSHEGREVLGRGPQGAVSSLPPSNLARSGHFVGLTSAAALATLPRRGQPSHEGEPWVLPNLLLRIERARLARVRVEFQPPRGRALSLHIEHGRPIVLATEKSLVRELFSLSEGQWSLHEPSSAPSGPTLTSSMFAFVVEGCQSILRMSTQAELEAIFADQRGLAPTVREARRWVIQKLGLHDRERRMVEHELDGQQSLDTLLGGATASRSSLLHLLGLLAAFDVVSFEPLAAKQGPDALSVLQARRERGLTANHFEVLDTHWSAPPADIEAAWLKVERETGPRSEAMARSPDDATAVYARAREAWDVLRDDMRRIAYTRRVLPTVNFEMLAPLVQGRVVALSMQKGSPRDLDDARRLLRELSPTLAAETDKMILRKA